MHKRIDWSLIFKVFAILVLGTLAVAPALGGTWLWDDDQQVTENMALRSVSGLWKIWFASMENDYFPLKSSVLWGLWHLWGPLPMGYRLFSLSCHLVSALLIWKLFTRINLKWGWLGGLLFVVHPLTVESVAWISEIKNTLSLPFLLMAMLLYIDYDDSRRGRRLAGSLLSFLAAMLCKSSVVMFPGVLLLYSWWKHGRISRRDFLLAVPFATISLVLGIVTIWFQNARAIGGSSIPELGLVARLAGAGTNTWFYLGKFLFPLDLSPIYPQWEIDPPSVWQLLSLPLLGMLFWWCWKMRTGWGRHAILGLGFFLLNILPVLGLLNMSFMNFSWVSDHFVYLPMIGLIGLGVAMAETVSCRLPPSWRMIEYFTLGGLIFVLLALSSSHATIFRDKTTMWTATLRANPKAYAAHNDLGAVYLKEGRLSEALAEIEEALRIRPEHARARINLGRVLTEAGRLEEALAEFREALRLEPRMVVARHNIGHVFLLQKKYAEADREFRFVISRDPYCAAAHSNLGIILALDGSTAQASEAFRTAISIDPTNDEAHRNLGVVLAQEGHSDGAREEFQKALKINPRNAGAEEGLRILQNEAAK